MCCNLGDSVSRVSPSRVIAHNALTSWIQDSPSDRQQLGLPSSRQASAVLLQACSSRDQARRRSSVCVGDVILLYLNVSQLVLGASLGRTCTRHGRRVASQPPQSAAAQSSPAMAAILTSVSTITSSESSEDTSVGPTLYACVRRPRRAQWVDLGDLAARAKSDRIIFARRMHRM
jgi:hypothetical protein